MSLDHTPAFAPTPPAALNLCPFCGAPVHEDHVVKNPGGLFHLTCPNCIATGPLATSVAAAVARWNCRTGGTAR